MTVSESPRPPGWVPDDSTFGARLALVRQRMGWGNVAEAARLCGIPVETWRTWERDGLTPRSLISACMKIAGVTGVDYRWLALGPDVRAEVSPVSVGNTDQYRGLGQRLVAVRGAERMRRGPYNTPVSRTRPIDGGPLALAGIG